MNIQEMHNSFRTLAQQMGMQLIRGILPESIDVYLNDVIVEKIQQELLSGVRTVIEETVTTQASTMSTINTFRTLYRNARFMFTSFNDTYAVKDDTQNILAYDYSNAQNSFYDYVNLQNGYYVINIPTVNTEIGVENNEYRINPMMYLGFSIEYENTLRGNPVSCRMIGSDIIETTLRDFCNGASKDSPIVCLLSQPLIENAREKTSGIANDQLEIYTNSKNVNIKYLNVKYIKKPNVVKWDIEINNCINCDLPDYTHHEIVERAVVKYQASIASIPSQQKGN